MSQNVCACPTAADRFVMPAHPQYPKLRAGTQLDAIYERLLRNGTCFRKPGLPQGLPRVVVVFDPRCSWSHIFWNTTLPISDAVDFHWFPVCVSADYSTAQAASMLASETPWDLMKTHQEAFEDPDFCGIHADDYPAEQKHRDLVWNNARIYRKAGGTSVPLGIFMNGQGQLVPLFGDMTMNEIRTVLGL